MLALYRSGRQSEALDAYADARHTLVDELGLEPGPELQELQQAILAHDESLRAPETPTGGTPALDRARRDCGRLCARSPRRSRVFALPRRRRRRRRPRPSARGVIASTPSRERSSGVSLPDARRRPSPRRRGVWLVDADARTVLRLVAVLAGRRDARDWRDAHRRRVRCRLGLGRERAALEGRSS